MNAQQLAELEKAGYVIQCDCGHGQDFRCAGEPHLPFALVCDKCGSVIAGRLPSDTRTPTERKLSKKIRKLFEGVAKVFHDIGEAMTVRGVYYRMEAAGYVDKTEAAYKQVQRVLYIGRWRGIIDFDLIIDESRFAFQSASFNGLPDAVDHISRVYRRKVWTDQKINLQVWIEKLALASIVLPVTKKYDVPLMPCRGYNSLSYLREAAENIKRSEFPTVIYHFGDFDPSGVQAGEAMEDQLSLLGAKRFHFERVAVTLEQIRKWNLPTRPTKRSDPRAKGWDNDSCDLDAMTPAQLRGLVEDSISRHIDPRIFEQTIKTEKAERETLNRIKEYLPMH